MPRAGEIAPGYAAAFGAALLDPDRAVPESVGSAFGPVATKRYAVYRNNVTVSLIEAMADIFPAIRRLLGEENFRGLAREFVRAEPPSSPLLFRYGKGFPAFMEKMEALADWPWLPDVARLELAWLAAYHAADAPPLAPAALASVVPDALAGLRFEPHPALAIIASRYAVASIVNTWRGEATPGRLDAGIPETALVTRPALAVEIRRLDPGVACFIETLASGATLGEAAEAGNEASAEFDLAAAIALTLAAGAFTAIRA